MGDVYMVNGKILSGLPNHAKDIIFDNDGTTLSSTNTEDAIKEVNSNLSQLGWHTIGSATATGAETYGAILASLFTQAGSVLDINKEYRLVTADTQYNYCIELTASYARFSYVQATGSGVQVIINAIGSTGYRSYCIGASAEVNVTNTNPSAGLKFRLDERS